MTKTLKKSNINQSKEPRLREALHTLGMNFSQKEIRRRDREELLYDAKICYISLMKLHHPDRGGHVDDAKALIVAFRRVKELLFPKVKIPKDSRPNPKRINRRTILNAI